MRALILVIICACTHDPPIVFHPQGGDDVEVKPKKPYTEHAVYVGPDGVVQLRAVAAEWLGTIAISMDSDVPRVQLRDLALDEAATRGGTHAYIGEGGLVVVRVKPERWRELPKALRPSPNTRATRRIDQKAQREQEQQDEQEDQAEDTDDRRETRIKMPDRPERGSWYCQSEQDSERCFRKRAACAAADAHVACASEDTAYCFGARGPASASRGDKDKDDDDGPPKLCFATMDGCHTSRDAAVQLRWKVTSDCEQSD